MPIATMTSKGRLTLPKEIRDWMGLRPRHQVDLVPNAEQVVLIRKRPAAARRELSGSLPSNGVALTPEEIDEAVMERHERSKR